MIDLSWLHLGLLNKRQPEPKPEVESMPLSPKDKLNMELMKLNREVMDTWGIVKMEPSEFKITYQHPFKRNKLVTLEASYSVVGIFLGDPEDPIASHFIYDAATADRISMMCRAATDHEEIQEALDALAKLDKFKQS